MPEFEVKRIFDTLPNGYMYLQCEPLLVIYISSRAREILSIEESGSLSEDIAACLHMDKDQALLFTSWINVALRLYKVQDWVKISAIAPVQSVTIQIPDSEPVTVGINYYPMGVMNKKLTGICIEAVSHVNQIASVHDADSVVLQRENEVKAILSIANTPWDDMKDFILDTAERLKNLSTSTEELEDIYKTLRSGYHNSEKTSAVELSERLQTIYIDTIFRHLHTIKGNALTYEFEELTQYAHESESLANQLRQPVTVRRTDVITSMMHHIDKLKKTFGFIITIFEKIYGNDEDRTVRLPLERIKSIHLLCTELESTPMSPSIARLVKECRTLSWKSLGSVTRKYGRVVYSRAVKMGKQIEFIVENSYTLVEPGIFKHLDDSLLQIVSNAVVHGIETDEIRCLSQKGPGHIRLSYQKTEEMVTITIADDGQGIRTDLLVEQFVNKGYLTQDAAGTMSEEEKIRLIFLPRSSTATSVTTFAGRGIGMDVVDNKIKLLGGTILVSTEAGKGTKFIITIPRKEKAELYE